MNKIETFFSVKTENLAEILLQQIDKTKSPFSKELILIPNSGMQRYLELKIAKDKGICTHIDITYLGSFFNDFYSKILAKQGKSLIKHNKHTITYQILSLFNEILDKNEIDDYLTKILKNNQQPNQKYYLASTIATHLLKYLEQRPEIISCWEQQSLFTDNIHEFWQKDIYHKLELSKQSIFFLKQKFNNFIKEKKQSLTKVVPETIHIFGFHFIPKHQLDDLFQISEYINLKFYSINPCVEFWGDIIRKEEKLRQEITDYDNKNFDISILFEVANPLLASWGSSAKFLIDSLNNHSTNNLDYIFNDKNTESNNNLDFLKNNIINLENKSIDNCKTKKSTKDDSITFKKASSPRREVEILYDYILDILENNDDIKPSDIIVTMPNVAIYSPYVNSIFSANKVLPFSISNQTAVDTDPDVNTFLALFDLINSNFSKTDFFNFCNQQTVREIFDFSLKELDSIKFYLDEAKVNWGYDENHKRKSLLCIENKDTEIDTNIYKQGHLQKMLDGLYLAYCCGKPLNHSQKIDEEIIGETIANKHFRTSQVEILAKLTKLFEMLKFAANVKFEQKTLTDWFRVLKQLSANFNTNKSKKNILNDLINDWFELIKQTKQTDLYDFSIIYTDICEIMTTQEMRGPFLSGSISFCSAIPMRSIPSKVTCMLGMNNDFPANLPKYEFDLLANSSKLSDKNLARESKYLFLESILATSDKFYLSYNGVDEKTGELISPSVLVLELEDYLQQIGINITKTTDLTEDYLQAFSKELFSPTIKTYSPFYKKPKKEKFINLDNSENIEIDKNWTINKLTKALTNPIKFYLDKNIGILTKEITSNDDYEAQNDSFISAHNALEEWFVNDCLIRAELENSDTKSKEYSKENFNKLLLAKNLQVPTIFKDFNYKNHYENIEIYLKTLSQLNLNNQTNIQILWSNNIYNIINKFNNIYDDRFILTTFSKFKFNNLLKTWLSHLILNTKKQITSIYVFKTSTAKKKEILTVTFAPIIDQDIVNNHINNILNALEFCFTKPIIFIPKAKITRAKIDIEQTLNEDILLDNIKEEINLCKENSEQQFENFSKLWNALKGGIVEVLD